NASADSTGSVNSTTCWPRSPEPHLLARRAVRSSVFLLCVRAGQEVVDEHGDLVRRGGQRKVAGVEDVNLGVRQVALICGGLGDLEARVVFPPHHKGFGLVFA